MWEFAGVSVCVCVCVCVYGLSVEGCDEPAVYGCDEPAVKTGCCPGCTMQAGSGLGERYVHVYTSSV